MTANIKRSGPVSIGDILTASEKGFTEFRNRAKEQRRLLLLVKELLPPELRDHCLACVTARNKLIVFSDSPVWASRLRFHENSIMDGLARRKSSTGFYRVVARVLLMPSIQEERKRYLKVVKVETAEALRSGAESINDTALKESLLRLSIALKRANRTPTSST